MTSVKTPFRFFRRYDTGLKKPNRRIALLDQLLSEQDFLVPGVFSVADVSVAAYFLYVLQFFPATDLSRWPSVVKYLQTCVSRPAYGQAFGNRVQSSLKGALAEMTQN
jgi:glutathione S-transferase